MRKILHCCFLFVYSFLFAAVAKAQINTSTMPTDMRGAYALKKQSINFGNDDSLIEKRQLKIYTDHYMMYVRHKYQDTLAEYGIGTYHMNGQTLVEDVFFDNEGPQSNSFLLDIAKTANGFQQVIRLEADASGRKSVLREEYKETSRGIHTLLDGAWKQTKVVYKPKNGSLQINTNPLQFKIYQSGNFIWASTTVEATVNQPISYYGFGTFKMKNKNKLSETVLSSSFVSQKLNAPLTLNIKFTGKDAYEQTLYWPNGDVKTEYYERMK